MSGFAMPHAVKFIAARSPARKSAYDPGDAGDDAARQMLEDENQSLQQVGSDNYRELSALVDQTRTALSKSTTEMLTNADFAVPSLDEVESLVGEMKTLVATNAEQMTRLNELSRLLGYI